MSKALTTERVSAFREAIQAGIDGFVRAGEIYVEAIDEDPKAADEFREKFADTIPVAMWGKFEALGRKWMHPKLLMGGVTSGKKQTIIKRLPYSLQERVFERERFPLLLDGGDTLEVDVIEATDAQAEQLFDGSAVRSLSAQRAYMEARKAAGGESFESLPYVVSGGKIRFRRNCEMSRAEIKRLLSEM